MIQHKEVTGAVISELVKGTMFENYSSYILWQVGLLSEEQAQEMNTKALNILERYYKNGSRNVQ